MVNAAQPVGITVQQSARLGLPRQGFTVLDHVGHTHASCRVILRTNLQIAFGPDHARADRRAGILSPGSGGS